MQNPASQKQRFQQQNNICTNAAVPQSRFHCDQWLFEPVSFFCSVMRKYKNV
uniref:Uncharacterized protein n=1 Tax=Anguilla anguilla TaxID=7936 RepID=A0A0E9WF71_ANGAN